MENKIIYQIKDNYADTRAKYSELFMYAKNLISDNIPKKYIDSKISYRHSYYFSDKKDAINFMDYLGDIQYHFFSKNLI